MPADTWLRARPVVVAEHHGRDEDGVGLRLRVRCRRVALRRAGGDRGPARPVARGRRRLEADPRRRDLAQRALGRAEQVRRVRREHVGATELLRVRVVHRRAGVRPLRHAAEGPEDALVAPDRLALSVAGGEARPEHAQHHDDENDQNRNRYHADDLSDSVRTPLFKPMSEHLWTALKTLMFRLSARNAGATRPGAPRGADSCRRDPTAPGPTGPSRRRSRGRPRRLPARRSGCSSRPPGT